MEPPVLKRVERLDSIPLSDTYWTEEGYLIDKPKIGRASCRERV